MLKQLMKAAGLGKTEEVVNPETEASTETIVESANANADAATEVVTEDLVVDSAELIAARDETIATLIASVAELTAKLADATAALEAVAAEKAALAAEAEAKRLAARKEKVEAAIGTEKAAGLLSATEGLDDAAFEAVVSALTGKVEAEATTDLFKEVGVTAEADAAKVGTESAEMKILKQKYQSK